VAYDVLTGGGLARDLPDLVFAPAHPLPGQGGDLVFEVRELADGTVALPVYSSIARLVAQLGGAQPWAELPLSAAREFMAKVGVRLVVLDAEVAPGAPRWRPDDLAGLAASVSDWRGEDP
jgi:hypothetical protein